MDRGGSLRFLLLGIAGIFMFMAMQKFTKGGETERQPLGGESHLVAPSRAPEQVCELWSNVSHAQVRSHGGALTHYQLLTAKYRKKGESLDISTTPDPGAEHEFRQQLFSRFRGDGPEIPNAPWNVKYDSVDYALSRADGKTCE